MTRQIFGLLLFGGGYALSYWALNILFNAYFPQRTSDLYPVPLSVCFGFRPPDKSTPRSGNGAAVGV